MLHQQVAANHGVSQICYNDLAGSSAGGALAQLQSDHSAGLRQIAATASNIAVATLLCWSRCRHNAAMLAGHAHDNVLDSMQHTKPY